MPELLTTMIVALPAGAALGVLFFGGLLWTTRRMTDSASPARLAVASFFVRTLVVLAGMALLAWRSWQAAAIALAGFTLVRLVIVGVAAPRNRQRSESA